VEESATKGPTKEAKGAMKDGKFGALPTWQKNDAYMENHQSCALISNVLNELKIQPCKVSMPMYQALASCKALSFVITVGWSEKYHLHNRNIERIVILQNR